jgi:hypothetical protein
MKIAMNLTMLVLLALQGEIAKASFDDYQRYRRGTYDFSFETRYEKTDANYLASGNTYRALPYGQSFELINFYLQARYDLSRRSSWYGQLNIASASSFGVDAKRSNSSVSDATLGYAYMAYSDAFDLITDFSVLAPFNKISENTDTVISNEGVVEAQALLRVQKDFSVIASYGYLGALYRQSRSALLPWGVGLETVAPEWIFGGKVFGYQSITDDSDTNSKTQRQIVTDRVNGGSLQFYAVNPSWIDSDVYVKFKSRAGWSIAGGGGTTLTGSNYAAGIHGAVNFTYAWDSEPSYYLKDSTTEDGLGSEKKVRKFKEQIDDGVDQKLFQKKKALPSGDNDEPQSSEAVTMRRVAPKEEAVNTTESEPMQLKLKKAKRRRD